MSLGLSVRLAQTLLASQLVLAWTFLMIEKLPRDYPKIAQHLPSLEQFACRRLPFLNDLIYVKYRN